MPVAIALPIVLVFIIMWCVAASVIRLIRDWHKQTGLYRTVEIFYILVGIVITVALSWIVVQNASPL